MSHPIPTSALDDRLFFGGIAGSGKTYGAGTAVERLLNTTARLVIPDPLGVWWGLALDKDGKSPSVYREQEKLVIFGGPRGDLPLTEHAGALIGETVAGMAESCILDLSELKTGAAERRFMLAFLTALYNNKTREPLHVVFDEADLWAPQRILDREGEAMKLLGMMENICRRGRVKGFIPWLISQRPAVISKNVLSQIDGMIAFKLTSVQDRDAIGDWVQGQADKAEWNKIWGNMPTLERGQGLVWLPARGILKTSAFPEKTTFDSSRTPKRGERIATKELQPLNIDKLKERLAKVDAEQKASDPKALRSEIAKLKGERAALERQMTQAVASKVVADPDAIRKAEERGFEQAKKKLWREAEEHARSTVIEAMDALDALISPIAVRLKEQLGASRKHRIDVRKIEFEPGPAPAPRVARPAQQPIPKISPIRQPAAPDENGLYNTPQVKVLTSLAMWRVLGHEHPTREMVAAAAGYKPSTGNYNNIIGSLVTVGAVGKPSPGCLSLLDGDVPVIGMDDGRAMLIGTLNGPQRRMVAAMIDQGSMSREELAQRTGYQPSTGNFNNLIGSLNTVGITVKPSPGYLQLSEWAQELLSGYAERLAA